MPATIITPDQDSVTKLYEREFISVREGHEFTRAATGRPETRLQPLRFALEIRGCGKLCQAPK